MPTSVQSHATQKVALPFIASDPVYLKPDAIDSTPIGCCKTPVLSTDRAHEDMEQTRTRTNRDTFPAPLKFSSATRKSITLMPGGPHEPLKPFASSLRVLSRSNFYEKLTPCLKMPVTCVRALLTSLCASDPTPYGSIQFRSWWRKLSGPNPLSILLIKQKAQPNGIFVCWLA